MILRIEEKMNKHMILLCRLCIFNIHIIARYFYLQTIQVKISKKDLGIKDFTCSVSWNA